MIFLKASSNAIDPLHQFVIEKYIDINLLGLDLSFTKSTLWKAIIFLTVLVFFVRPAFNMTLIPNRMQVITEELYNFIANMVKSTCGDAGMKYFPFIFTLFVFIVCSNVFGLFPASFTVTSHIAVTGVLALLVFAIMLIAGFSTSGIGFLGHFVPQGLPKALLPLMIPIEIISYLARPFTLALRLAANMTAGHIMLKILGGFVVMMGVVGVLPFILLVPVTALELFVALLQAYVFTILTCIYLSDSLHPHH